MKYPSSDLSHGIILGFLVVLILALGLAVAYYQFRPGSLRYKCSDFGIHEDAQEAYDKGATYLDGTDADQIPCNSLLTG